MLISLVHLSPQLVEVAPMYYTPMVYIDPKVQPPLLKQDLKKHTKSYKTSKTDIIATISNQLNAPSNILPFL